MEASSTPPATSEQGPRQCARGTGAGSDDAQELARRGAAVVEGRRHSSALRRPRPADERQIVTLGLRQLALTAVREGSGQLVLREIEDRDLGVLFEHATDPDAIRMAAFTSPEADDRTSFERRWARLRNDGSTTNRVVEIDGRVVGHIASFDLEGQREVTYWIGREHWGRGIATRALQEFLQLEATRPLYAHAASDNAASIRVLTKCGFLIVGEGRGFAHGRNEETDEVVLRLDA
jgi:RimJ/RimL family protein N-acetyltransferase